MATSESTKQSLNRADINTLADALRALAFGTILRTLVTWLYRKAASASVLQIAAVQTIVLPDDAKALKVLRATAIVGTGTKGELVVVGYGVTPGAGEVGIAPNGDLAFAAADAWTSVDVQYQPDKNDVLELTLPVVPGTGVMALPPGIAARLKGIMEATALTGGVVGGCIVIVPGAVPGTTKQANIDLAHTQVQFKVADAVTKATVKLALIPAIDVNALLEAPSNFI